MTAHKKAIMREENAFVFTRTRKSRRWNRVVVFDLILIVEGLQLKYEARWPSGANSLADVKVKKTGYVSLAPSLPPGTA